VHYIDDLGQVSEVQTLSTQIDHMLFFEKKSRLVILTRTLILVQLEIRSDCKVVPIMKTKVAVAGGSPERGITHVCWAGPGIIAAATGEVSERSGLSVSKFKEAKLSCANRH
jgi:intraflagellar transport protein 140